MNKLILFCCFFAVQLLPQSMADSGQHVSTDQIIMSCNSQHEGVVLREDSACLVYIDGFIAGAKTFDSVMVSHVRQAHKDSSEFFQRAYRTRVGVEKSGYIKNQQALFCMPLGISAAQLAVEVAEKTPSNMTNREQLNEYVVDALVERYPCI